METRWTNYPANIDLDKDFLKTSWRRLLSLSSEDVLKTFSRRLDQDEYIRLIHTSSEDVLMKNNIFVLVIRLQAFSRQLQDIFKTTSRHVQDILLGHLQDVLQICLQYVFKTHHQVKLFLLTPLKDVFETYSRGFWDVLQRQLSTKGFA